MNSFQEQTIQSAKPVLNRFRICSVLESCDHCMFHFRDFSGRIFQSWITTRATKEKSGNVKNKQKRREREKSHGKHRNGEEDVAGFCDEFTPNTRVSQR